MKFTDGQWLVRKGITIHGGVQVVDAEFDKNSAILYLTTFRVNGRGDTLGGPVITVELTSPTEGVIGVKMTHFKGIEGKEPKFELNAEADRKAEINETRDGIVFKSGHLSAVMNREGNWSLDFFRDERPITRSPFRAMAYVTEDGGKTYMREQLELDADEFVYGLGERFTPFVKNGQIVDIWNEDGGTSTEQSYKNIPFYVTSKGYGVFVNDPGKVSFEVASEKVSRIQFSVPGESMEYFVADGPSIKDVLKRYTSLTGRPALPPAWSFGLWLTTSFTTDYDEKTVTGFIDGMTERGIPLRVFHFDCFWMKEFQWSDFEWNDRQFPDPESMLKRLKKKGINVSVWINPYIAQKSPLFDESVKNGYLLKRENGDVWQWDLWQPGMGIVDFTNPKACEWYSEKLKKLVDMGVDCFKTDFGERIPTDVVYHDGSDPERMHNYYTYLYNKTVHSALEEKKGSKNAVLFARSATVGSQKFPVHWGGDCSASYASMAESLRGGLSLGMSGFGFWSHDISGFESAATPDIYKRWTAFGLLSSHSRLHGNETYKVPWLYDEEAVDVLRFFTRLKYRLMPYLYGAAVEASKEGIPMMRAMVMEFPEDPACFHIGMQYMLGESLLVAPIFNENGTVAYYLPKGRWTNFITGEVLEGERWVKESHDYMSLPLMVRPHSIVAVGNTDEKPDYDYADGVTFHVFGATNGDFSTSTVLNDPNGEEEMKIEIEKKNKSMNVGIERFKEDAKPWSLILRNVEKIEGVEGGSYEKESTGIKIIPDGNARSIEIGF